MSFCPGWRLLASGALFFALLSRAHGDPKSDAIARLLDVGWSITPQARAAADEQYEKVVALAGKDARALEASWLVLMQQRRFDEALKRLDEHLAAEPDDLAALRAKTWVQTVLKNYAAAFVSADRLSILLAAQPPKADADRAVHDEAVGFLGRLVGYFGGPIADAINQDERKRLEKKFLERLEESKRSLFEDSRNSVLAKFIEMTDESTAERERATTTAKAEKEKTLAELQADKEKLDAREKELEERRNKLNSEFKSELDQLAKQEQPLVQQQAQLNSQAAILNADLFGFSSQIATLQQLAAQEKNAQRQQQLLAQANSLALVAGRVEADLAAINRLTRGVQTQRAGLAARRNQAQSNTASQVDRIDRELADLGKRERRNEGLEKRANRPGAGGTSKIRSLSAQATALSTYDAFPLEAAKARLLESLR
jgi:DNA repair exonuclease SbcCD ATPase subunit